MSSSNGSSSHKHYAEKAVGLTSEPKSGTPSSSGGKVHNFARGAQERAVAVETEPSLFETMKTSLDDTIMGPLADYTWNLHPNLLTVLAWVLVLIQLATFFGFCAYYYESITTAPFISAEGLNTATHSCSEVRKYVNGDYYATIEGQWVTSNADPNAFLQFSFTNFQAGSLDEIFHDIQIALLEVVQLSENNSLVYNHITLFNWQRNITGSEGHGYVIVSFYSEPSTYGAYVMPLYMTSSLHDSEACGVSLFQGQAGTAKGRSVLSQKVYFPASDIANEPPLNIPGCSATSNTFSVLHAASNANPVEYDFEVNVESASTAMAVNMGVLDLSSLTKLTMVPIVQPTAPGLGVYSLPRYYDSAEKTPIFCANPSEMDSATLKLMKITKAHKPLCTLLTGTHVAIQPLLPVVTESLVFGTATYDPSPFCTCERTDFKLDVSKIIGTMNNFVQSEPAFGGDPTSKCTDGVGTIYSFIGSKNSGLAEGVRSASDPKNTSLYFPSSMSFYYSLVYTDDNPQGDYKMFMNNISNSVWLHNYYNGVGGMTPPWNLTDHYVFEAWTSPQPYQYTSPRGLVYLNTTRNWSFPFNSLAMEETNKILEKSAQDLGYFDFCKNSSGVDQGCYMIQYRVANLYTSINKAGYMYQDGNCNNVLGVIQADPSSYLERTCRNLREAEPPFRLTENYYTCQEKPQSAILKSFPLSASMMQTVTITYVIVFLPALLWLLSKTAFGQKFTRFKYSAEELKVASTELSLHLLRARDNDTLGITSKGTIDNLSRDLLKAALYTGGYVDSNEDVDIDAYMGSRSTEGSSAEMIAEMKWKEAVRTELNKRETSTHMGGRRRFSARMSSQRLIESRRSSMTAGEGAGAGVMAPDAVPPPEVDSQLPGSVSAAEQVEVGQGIQLSSNPLHQTGTL